MGKWSLQDGGCLREVVTETGLTVFMKLLSNCLLRRGFAFDNILRTALVN